MDILPLLVMLLPLLLPISVESCAPSLGDAPAHHDPLSAGMSVLCVRCVFGV